jgi:ABC-2 type transport system ATP-binding protein
LFNISGDQHQLIGSYSHGMRQKIALIAALVHTPANLFLDEPLWAWIPVRHGC